MEMAAETAKLFWNGRSQAVRLPKDYRFEGTEVRIRKSGNAVILEPVENDWSWLDALSGEFDDDFLTAIDEPAEQQERPELDNLFP
jgi:antitoxin VapB